MFGLSALSKSGEGVSILVFVRSKTLKVSDKHRQSEDKLWGTPALGTLEGLVDLVC